MNKAAAETIEVIRFSSTKPGPHLLVFGAIHGNERCGPKALGKAVARFQKGLWQLSCGKVTFVPVCNPLAHAKNQRYADKNLNRVFLKHKKPSCYEEKIANILTDLVDECDWLLDIHSFHTQGLGFAFQDYTDARTKVFARTLGLRHIVSGWPQMYAQPNVKALNEGDTLSYAHKQKKTGVLIECGQHDNPHNVSVALKAIGNALSFLGLINSKAKSPAAKNDTVDIRGHHVVTKNKKGSLVKNWKNFDTLRKGDIIARYADGTVEQAPRDGVIMMPAPKGKVGEEWFIFGTRLRR